MAGESLQTMLRRLRRLAEPPTAGLTDAQLLGRFVADRDEAAFELLLRRHGGMILALCRRLSRHEQDAEDAFQATFLALARQAGSIAKRASLGSWLYKVAYRAALSARARALRRATVEGPLAGEPAADLVPAVDGRDLRAVLDAEIHRLPEHYRVPFVLCQLEGLTLAEVAKLLGRPRATIGTRLARARQRLRNRLTGRGLGLPAAALAALVTGQVTAAVLTPGLVGAILAAAGSGSAPARVAELTEGVLRAMLLSKLKAVMAAVLVFAALGTGMGGVGYRMLAAEGPGELPAPAKADGTPAPDAKAQLVLRGWGAVTDPEGDCKFIIEKDKLSIAVPGTDHALCIEQNRMNAPRVLRPAEGDFVVQVKVSGKFPAGQSRVPTRGPFHGAGLLVWKDAKTYVRLERAVSDDATVGYASWELRKGGEFARIGGNDDLNLRGEAAWLRIERRGNTLYGAVSTDGIQWTTMEPMTVELPHRLLAGAVAGQNTSVGFTPTFEEFRLFQAIEDR